MSDIYTSEKKKNDPEDVCEPSVETLILLKHFARLYDPLKIMGANSAILPN